MKESTDLFFNKIVQIFFMVGNPLRQLLILNAPLVIIFLAHVKDNAVTAVIRNIHMKYSAGSSRHQPKIEFSQAVIGFDQLGKMYVANEIELHVRCNLANPSNDRALKTQGKHN